MVRNKKCLISIILLALVLISIIPQMAFASTGFTPVDGIASAGGSGKSPGNPTPGGNSGVWSSRFQGFRIAVLGYDGAPAFTFMGKDYLDLVFSYDNIDAMDYFGDNHKLGILRNINENKNELNTKILSISDINGLLNNKGLVTAVPNGAYLNKAINNFTASKIPYPLNLVGGNWVTYGNEIKNVFYGSSDKLDINALLYVILNLSSMDDSGNYLRLWQPKPSAFIPGDNYTTEQINQFNEGTLPPIKLMESKELLISIEPIIWNKLRLSSSQYSYGVYGTQTAIGWIVDWLETPDSNGKVWFNPTAGKGAGGYDTSLFGRMGRRSMVTDKISFIFNSYRDNNGKIVNDYEWWIKPPVDTGQMITNKVIGDMQPGWSLHLYRLKASAESSTKTFDTPEGNNPHKAPDPSAIPLAENEKQEKRNITIVKTYEEDNIHVGTYIRNNNPHNIEIQDEIDYKIDEWFISKDNINPNQSTTWTEIKNSASSSKSGNSTTTVKVEDSNTTLYVKLVKKAPPAPPGTAGLIIEESQITKAVDTMDSSITGWGPRTMNFQYQNLSGRCPVIEYCGGCRGNSEDGYWCPGHECKSSYILNDVNFNYFFKNTEAINNKLQGNVGIFEALNTKDDKDSKGNRSNINAGIDSVNSFNYQLVIWRGKDIPTLANYKVAAGHELNALLNKYGKQPIGTRLNSDYIEMLNIKLDKDNGHSKSDYYTDSKCPTHGVKLKSTAENTDTLDYKADVVVKVYTGVQHQKGNIKNTNSARLLANLVGKPVTPKFSGGTAIDSSTPLTFYPYIRMTYQKPAMTFNDRIDVNVLSQWISELHPHSYAEASWGSTKDINMNISSVQWSTHKRAIEGTDGWQGRNKVLPGGAVFTLDTKNQNTYASVITWQPYLENEIANKVIISGAGSYKLADTSKPHNDLVDSAKKALDNWRIVQYVEKNTNASDAFGGLKITGGGESLTTLGLTNKSSTEAKYYLKTDGVGEVSGQGDLDIINTTVTEIHYKVKADTQGNVYVQRNRDGSGWVTIDTISKNKKVSDLSSILSNESKQLDERTKIITNVLTVLTRNVGDDKSASWATSDGKWYNEAFDGINYIRQETCFEVGFADSPLRSAAIDPRLTPPNTGQGDLFSKAFISQFRLNDKSDAYTSEVAGYVGKFKGQVVKLPGADNMYKTRVFAIPNANVQDLK